jgi:hypothetical protein
MRSENKIRKQLEKLKNQRLNGGPSSELKSIAWHGAKQALEWVLEETENPLTY